MEEDKLMTPEQVKHIAHLSRIQLREGDVEKFAPQLRNILEHVKILQKVDTTDIDPAFQTAVLSNVLRKDEVRDSLPVDEVLANAPGREENHFKMPRILKVEDTS